jgi:hypothetical protein
MRYFESKQIHSCLAAFSTRDAFVTRLITRAEFVAHEGEKTISRKHGFSVAYSESDKQFYDVRSFSHATKETMGAYIWTTYLLEGWAVNDSFLKTAQAAHWHDKELADTARRTRQGYVIPQWSREIPPEEYQGGFSNDVFFNPALFDYVKAGGCHGFIGHSVRKAKLDAYFEAQFLLLNPDKSLLAMWLTSTGGRHFGDSLEGIPFREQQSYIRRSIEGIIAKADRYRAQDTAAA